MLRPRHELQLKATINESKKEQSNLGIVIIDLIIDLGFNHRFDNAFRSPLFIFLRHEVQLKAKSMNQRRNSQKGIV